MKLGTFLCLVFMIGFLAFGFAIFVVTLAIPSAVNKSLLFAYSVPLTAFLLYTMADDKTLNKQIFTRRDNKK